MRALLCFLACCGNAAPAKHDAAPAKRPDAGAVTIELPAKPLGLPELAGFDWRKRGGQSAFAAARKAENKEDWAAVVVACKQALAADPTHLEAAWLLAAGNAKLGKLDEILAPLTVAVSGDFGKWADASLELPAMQAWLATPEGDAWKRRIAADHARYTAMLAKALIVYARGDLFAFGDRWYRLTRTGGAAVAALEADHRLAYVARLKGKKTGIGVIDLVGGRATRPVDSGITGLFQLARAKDGFWVAANGAARTVDDDARYHAVPGKPARPAGPWLEISGKSARIHRLPVPDVSADFDDHSLASAIKLKGGRVISAPAPGLIDGNAIAWAPDHLHLAFVAQLDEHCAPGSISAAAYLADATTGQVTELERGKHGLAVEWVSDRVLAVAGDKGVTLVEGDQKTPIPGAEGLLCPRRVPRCTPDEPIDEPPPPDEETVE